MKTLPKIKNLIADSFLSLRKNFLWFFLLAFLFSAFRSLNISQLVPYGWGFEFLFVIPWSLIFTVFVCKSMEGRPNKDIGISEMFRKGLIPILKFFALAQVLFALFLIPIIFLIASCMSQYENLFYGALLCHNANKAFVFLLSSFLDFSFLAAKTFFYGFKPILDVVGFLFDQQKWPFLVAALLSALIWRYYYFRLVLLIIAGCFGDRSTIKRSWSLSQGRVWYLVKLYVSVVFIMSLIAFIGHFITAYTLGYQAPEQFKYDARTPAFYQKKASMSPLEDPLKIEGPLKTYSHLTANQILMGKITPKEIPEDQRFNFEGGIIGMIMNLFICIGYYLLTYCFARVYLHVRSED